MAEVFVDDIHASAAELFSAYRKTKQEMNILIKEKKCLKTEFQETKEKYESELLFPRAHGFRI